MWRAVFLTCETFVHSVTLFSPFRTKMMPKCCGALRKGGRGSATREAQTYNTVSVYPHTQTMGGHGIEQIPLRRRCQQGFVRDDGLNVLLVDVDVVLHVAPLGRCLCSHTNYKHDTFLLDDTARSSALLGSDNVCPVQFALGPKAKGANVPKGAKEQWRTAKYCMDGMLMHRLNPTQIMFVACTEHVAIQLVLSFVCDERHYASFFNPLSHN